MMIKVSWSNAVPVLGERQFRELLIPNEQAICLLLADMAILADVFYPTVAAEHLWTAQNSLIDDLFSHVGFEAWFFDGCLDLNLGLLSMLGDPFSNLLSPTCRHPPR